jgi:cob(I)alamin adenosyltransferase
MREGLILVYTGKGKGKTSAAIGQIVRALGHDWRVALIQFIKHRKTGEHLALEAFTHLLDIHVAGAGFTKTGNPEEHAARAREAWRLATTIISAGEHELVVLDELTYLAKYGMVHEAEILETLQNRPPGMHIVVTGRDAGNGLLAAADLVSNIEPVKHHYASGIKAQLGIEF